MTTKTGVNEIADGVFAYLQQGSWGYSNAGFVKSGGASLLVDTLYDLKLTAQMLSALRKVAGASAKVDTVVNTHANGDHCWGNQLLPEAQIISSRRAAEEMLELPPKLMHTLVQLSRAVVGLGGMARTPLRLLSRLGLRQAGDLLEAAPLLADKFGPFEFGDIALRAPDKTFDGRLELTVGDTPVQLIEVGPAHTRGDVIVFLPKQRVVFSGDVLFIDSHPIIWAGPIDNWIRALDVMLALDVDVIVPGHGPITDKRGVARTKQYWEDLQRAARQVHAGALTEADAVRALLDKAGAWAEDERIVVNMDTALRELGQGGKARHPISLLAQMARHVAHTAQKA